MGVAFPLNTPLLIYPAYATTFSIYPWNIFQLFVVVRFLGFLGFLFLSTWPACRPPAVGAVAAVELTNFNPRPSSIILDYPRLFSIFLDFPRQSSKEHSIYYFPSWIWLRPWCAPSCAHSTTIRRRLIGDTSSLSMRSSFTLLCATMTCPIWWIWIWRICIKSVAGFAKIASFRCKAFPEAPVFLPLPVVWR